MAKRPKANLGTESYNAFLKALHKQSALPTLARAPLRVGIVFATCSGLNNLSEAVGRRLCHVAIAADGRSYVRGLAEAGYARWVLDDGCDDGLKETTGFDDWTMVCLTHDMTKGVDLPTGVSILKGQLVVSLSRGMVTAAFARWFSLLMQTSRYDESLLSAAAVQARIRARRKLEIPPRFSLSDGQESHALKRVTDIYVADPWTDLFRIATIAAAASMDHQPSLTSHETN